MILLKIVLRLINLIASIKDGSKNRYSIFKKNIIYIGFATLFIKLVFF